MDNNRFDDTRNSFLNIIQIFRNYNTYESPYRNIEFENDVYQVISRKSIRNFELFAYAFDIIYDNKIENLEDFDNILNKKRNNNDQKKKKRIEHLYFDTDNIEERNRTIEIALRIYKQHLSMIKVYDNLYSKLREDFSKIDNKIFNYDFYQNDYKYTNISFDVFLSHRYYLRFYNIIIFYILTVYFNLVVYVDWIFDYNVNRKKLSEDTVKLLKYRMNQSKKLIFFNILNSNTTNWMAWEVGYFSCLKEESIAILDLDGYCTGNKNVEVLSSNDRILFDISKGLYLEKTNQSIKDWI